MDETTSRRTLLRQGAALAAAAGAATALPEQVWAGWSVSTRRQGGTLIAALPRDIVTLDPHRNTLAVFRANFRSAVFDSLVFVRPNLSVEPRLAESWDTSRDGKTITFRLRKDVVFHDGKPFTASDVAFTVRRILNPKTASPMIPYVDVVQGIQILSKHVIRFRLKHPALYFIPLLNWVQIVSGSSISSIETRPIGTGPFKFVEWKPNDQIVLERNDRYFRRGLPASDGVVYKVIPDSEARIASLRAGSVHMVDPVAAKDLDKLSSLGFRVFSTPPTMRYQNFHINTARGGALGDKRVRQAMSHAFDRDAYVKAVWFGHARPSVTPFVKEMPTYLPGADRRYPFDLTKADALLAQAGAKPLTFEILNIEGDETGRAAALVLQANLNKLGNNVTVRDLAGATWVDRVVTTGDYDVSTDFFVTIPEDPHGMFAAENLNAANLNKWTPPHFLKLRARAAQERNPKKRIQLYRQLQQLLLEEVPMIVLTHYPLSIAYARGVQGPTIGPSDFRDWAVAKIA